MHRALLALLIALVVASTAAAQEPTAEELLEHGVALREDGRDGEALEIFQRAYRTEPSGHAMTQIALAEQALGRLVDAEAHLTEALASTSDRFVRRNRALLEQALDEIRAQLTDLTVTGGPDGAELLVDGTLRGRLPLPGTIRVQAGTAHVEVRAEGYQPFTRELIVEAGTPPALAVTLEPVPSVAPVVMAEPQPEPVTTPPPGADANAWRMPVGIALGAAGLVGIGVASGLMAWREDNARARLTCSDTDPACRAHYGTAVDAEAAGIGTFVVSGLFAAAGAFLIVWDVMDRGSTEHARLTCAPGLLTLSCAGVF